MARARWALSGSVTLEYLIISAPRRTRMLCLRLQAWLEKMHPIMQAISKAMLRTRLVLHLVLFCSWMASARESEIAPSK